MSKWVYANCALFIVFIAMGVSLSISFPQLFHHPKTLQVLFAALACTPPILYLFEKRKKGEKKAALCGTAFLVANPVLAWNLCYSIILGYARVGTSAD